MNRETIHTQDAPKALGPYEQAIRVGDMLFTSGQLGIDPATDALPDSVEAQAYNAMKNLGAILREAGADYKNVVKTTVFLADLGDFATVNGIYESYFDGVFPARSCVQVARLPKDALIEVECIAAL